jgi:hypothetical protein
MIAEDLLERGLAAAGDEYDVPEGGVDRVRGLLAPSVAEENADEPRRLALRRPGKRGWIAIAAAAVVLLVAVPLAVGGANDLTNQTRLSPLADSPAFENRPSADAAVGAGTGAGSSAGASPSRASAQSALSYGAYDSTTPALPDQLNGPRDPVPTSPDRVVKTGILDLQAPKGKVGDTINAVTKVATIEGGYVQSSRTSEGGAVPSGQVTLRVPVQKFDDAIERVRLIGHAPGAKVLGLETSSEDVTSKYVDLQARVHALQRTRDAFLTLLSKATTIGETLSVQQRISDVQSQIERLQGPVKVLGSRSSMSTLTVTIDQKIAVESAPGEKSGIHKAFDRSVDRFVNGVEAIVAGTGPVLLAIIVIAALWFGGRFGYRVLRRNMV